MCEIDKQPSIKRFIALLALGLIGIIHIAFIMPLFLKLPKIKGDTVDTIIPICKYFVTLDWVSIWVLLGLASVPQIISFLRGTPSGSTTITDETKIQGASATQTTTTIIPPVPPQPQPDNVPN